MDRIARFFPDLREIFREDELYKILNVSVMSTPWERKFRIFISSIRLLL